jgi:hypothetical protein
MTRMGRETCILEPSPNPPVVVNTGGGFESVDCRVDGLKLKTVKKAARPAEIVGGPDPSNGSHS